MVVVTVSFLMSLTLYNTQLSIITEFIAAENIILMLIST